MASVFTDLAAERRATLAMMEEAAASRQQHGRPDSGLDAKLAAARTGDWSWSSFLGGTATLPPSTASQELPPETPGPAFDGSAHLPNPATAPQLQYLRVLVAKLDRLSPPADPDAFVFTDEQWAKLTKKSASALIDKLGAVVERLEREPRQRLSDARPPGLTLPAEIRKAAQEPTKADVPAGRYAVHGADGTVDFYKVDQPTEGRWAGYTFASLLIGTPGDWSKQRLSKLATATLLDRIRQAGVENAARLFGEKTATCGHCSSPLSDLQSRCAGYGQTCAGKHGYWYPTLAQARQIMGEGVDPESNAPVG